MVKIITLFLIVIAVLAMFGRWRWPLAKGKAKAQELPRPCGRCGALVKPRTQCGCKDKGSR